MASHNSYIRYKRDTRDLVRWMVHTSNSLISSSSSAPAQNSVPVTVNKTGEIQVSDFIPLSSLIAKHTSPISPTIYRLFQAIIDARSATYALFQQIVTARPDPDIEKGNISHRYFIETLTEAFKILGGEEWTSRSKFEANNADEADIDEVLLANKFSALGIDGPSDGEEAEDAAEGESNDRPKRPAKNSTAKRKKGKRGKRAKGKKPAVSEAKLDDVPLESYRIIEDESGLVTDYLMAVYSLAQEWVELRHHLQKLWREVSYSGLNSAVAGALSNIAVAMIKQTQTAIFVNFPGHDSFETVMKTITRGDPEKTQGSFHMSLHRVGSHTKAAEKVQEVDIDVKEQFLIYTYWDLLDFILDFQTNRSGKPTKRMLSEIRDWDPNFDLQGATKEQRIKWRRAYTINWLYDLVNVFSSIVVQRNNLKGEKWDLEKVNWSINGPWHQHRRLFGLNELASDITSLAMQKKGTDVGQKILPHHVFQIQCIVDSLAVSRGWSINSLKGHILHPPARGFRPRRDVDLFLDRDNERLGHGYCDAVNGLIQFFEQDAMLHGEPNRHQESSELLKDFVFDFVNWLGESKYMYGLQSIPPSRFSNTNANGLWEYSPFLCGAGLVEALELAYDMSFLVWDRIPEPICLIHLHNMLVRKGYITEPIGLYASLQNLFPTAFFAGGKIPTSGFNAAFLAVLNETGSHRANFQRRSIRRATTRTAPDLHGLLDLNGNRYFKQKSLLRIYDKAQWVPEHIRDEDISPASALGSLRICQAKKFVDPITGKRALENTDLVRRARSHGVSDEAMIEMSSVLQGRSTDHQIPEAFMPSPEGYKTLPAPGNKRGKGIVSGSDLLTFLKIDLINDISGDRPLSSLNYIWAASRFMIFFEQIEDDLKRLRNPSWVHAYEDASMRQKRVSLTVLALVGDDEECMEVMAKAFQGFRAEFMQHIYWEDLKNVAETVSRDPVDEDEMGGSCAVM